MEVNGTNHQKIVNIDDLDVGDQDLIRKAVEARNFAYCPYSNFAVGSALRTNTGEIFTGCNVENVAHSPGVCAERTAIVKAVSEGFTKFDAIAVVAYLENDFCTPCGVCRQALSEFASPDIKVFVAKPVAIRVLCTSVQELLPYRFSPDKLQKQL
ncbi:hypothetical protein PVAND_013453 [Polypedilum vanderplanki]|uniref:Cytidine deaminase n=1 Tax=Polypedilum vanderplanki TaxID=319348 RepID=A0A9J6CQR2_POLVA|nr:hypothetical protein PVAND_013453 [Polypedilum vanderplanki]